MDREFVALRLAESLTRVLAHASRERHVTKLLRCLEDALESDTEIAALCEADALFQKTLAAYSTALALRAAEFRILENPPQSKGH